VISPHLPPLARRPMALHGMEQYRGSTPNFARYDLIEPGRRKNDFPHVLQENSIDLTGFGRP
jgi:hypothetical protein